MRASACLLVLTAFTLAGNAWAQSADAAAPAGNESGAPPADIHLPEPMPPASRG